MNLNPNETSCPRTQLARQIKYARKGVSKKENKRKLSSPNLTIHEWHIRVMKVALMLNGKDFDYIKQLKALKNKKTLNLT